MHALTLHAPRALTYASTHTLGPHTPSTRHHDLAHTTITPRALCLPLRSGSPHPPLNFSAASEDSGRNHRVLGEPQRPHRVGALLPSRGSEGNSGPRERGQKSHNNELWLSFDLCAGLYL